LDTIHLCERVEMPCIVAGMLDLDLWINDAGEHVL
jgi:hypothetical protein